MDYTIGTITLFPYTFAPMGWYLCNGQILPISGSETLFALIGNSYGGDGSTNFALPNMQGLEPIPGVNYYICYEGIYPTRP